MDEKQELIRRLGEYEKLRQQLEVLDLAMEGLTPEERVVLDRMVLRPHKRAVQELCNLLDVERSGVYRRRESALRKVAVALWGEEKAC